MWQLIKQIARTGRPDEPAPAGEPAWQRDAQPIRQEILDILGRALCIRAIDAGSCNGCELELNALGNPYYNIEGLGIKFVASPRHADMLLITGPLTLNMRTARTAHRDGRRDRARSANLPIPSVGEFLRALRVILRRSRLLLIFNQALFIAPLMDRKIQKVAAPARSCTRSETPVSFPKDAKTHCHRSSPAERATE